MNQLQRYHTLRGEIIKILGGKCVRCGSTENLELDHKDRSTKTVSVGQIFNLSLKRIWEEAIKCQLFCRKCHQLKTITDLGKKVAKGTHGTLSAYSYCHCEACRKAKTEWQKEYYKTHKRVTVNGKRIVIKTEA